MSATLILTTPDPGLEAAWRTQLLPQEPAAFPRAADLQRELLRPGSRVWVSDINDPRVRLTRGAGTLVILVGEPHSLPFEFERQNRNARLFLSYADSRTRLGETVALLAEIADKNAQLQAALERTRRTEHPFPREAAAPAPAVESWDFLESALHHLGDRPRLLDEFRRAGRYILKAGKVLFFFRDQDAFVSDDEVHRLDSAHPLALWLEDHPATLDLADWDGADDPTLDAPIRQQMQGWSARLLLPLHVRGQLHGWMTLGPRADGAAYRDHDKFRAVLHARLLERCLERSLQFEELTREQQGAGLRAKYLPGARLLTRADLADPALPVEVRAVAGEALHRGQTVTQPAEPPHRYRVQAGPVPEIQGVWAIWEEAEPEIKRVRTDLERRRRELLSDLGLTLSHEISNPLVALVTFSHLLRRAAAASAPPPAAAPGTASADSGSPFANRVIAFVAPADDAALAAAAAPEGAFPEAAAPAPPAAPASSRPPAASPPSALALAQGLTLATEIGRLQRLADDSLLFGEIAQAVARPVNLHALLRELGTARDMAMRFSDEPIILSGDEKLLRFAFTAILDAIGANRPERGLADLILVLRATGPKPDVTALVSVMGKNLELDGTHPAPAPDTTPNQGRLSVWLAREILRLHDGTLQAGPGLKGTEIQLSLGALRAPAVRHEAPESSVAGGVRVPAEAPPKPPRRR